MNLRLFHKLIPAALTLAFAGTGCVPPEELDGDVLEPSMEWDEFVFSGDGQEPVSSASANATPAPVLIKKYTAVGGSDLSRRLALNAIENPFPYAGGVLGTKGDSKYFIASTMAIPEFDRLYWVMVKVLSEKYGCFIRAKQDIGTMTRITCKDRRQVLFWKNRNQDYIEFMARQYDRDGFEIKVIHKKIVRISNNRVI
jgi:hypothetical protein